MDDFDAFYTALEERFRGSYESIKSRLEAYLPFVKTAGTGANLGPVLDLGSGRGEWLDLLREHGVPATGIDQNIKAADNATRHGLDIEIGDIFDILPSKPSGYYGAVTAFHVIEHLELRLQLRLLRESFRILKPGGLLLLEWPNIRNLRVATYSFWLDPTHVRPLPTELVCFMVEFSGFRDVTTERFRAGQGVQSHPKRGILKRVADRILGDQSNDPATMQLNALLTPGMDVMLRAQKLL